MVNGVPWEVLRPKTLRTCGPSGLGMGTSLGTPFTMTPPRLFHTLSQCVQVLERTRGQLGELAVEEGEMRGRQVFRANMLQHMAGREEDEEGEGEGLERDREVIRTNLLNNISDRDGQDGGGRHAKW